MNPDQTVSKVAEYGMTGTPAIIGLIVAVLIVVAAITWYVRRNR